jgi:hypothetical protein
MMEHVHPLIWWGRRLLTTFVVLSISLLVRALV